MDYFEIMKKKQRTQRMVIAVVLLVGVTCYLGVKLFGVSYQTSEQAVVSGVVIDIEKTGYIWKTWEGKISPGFGEANSGGASNAVHYPFSVKDEVVAQEVRQAARSGKRVNLRYSSYALRPWRDGNTAHNVEGVEYVK
jgi:hypothetical protein